MGSLIIGLLQQKGGVGKTTLAINLAAASSAKGLRTLLIDADPQASAMAWASMRQNKPSFPVVAMPTPNLHRELVEIGRDYDVVIIDGAPRVNDLARSAILASDMILIPVQPSPLDVWASQETVALIKEAQIYAPNVKAAFVINRKVANTVIGRDVACAFDEQPFDVSNATISQRVIFAESIAQGMSVIDTELNGLPASEIFALLSYCQQQSKERKAA